MKNKLAKITNIIYPLIGVAAFLLLWFVVAKVVDIELILPTPAMAFKEFFLLWGEKSFWMAVGNTLLRTIVAFVIAFLLAMILSIISYLCEPFKRIISPLIIILRATPTMSIILLAIIWMTSKTSPILISFLIIFPILYSDFYSALEGIDKGLIEMSNSYNVPISTQIKELYVPSTLPYVFASVKSTLSFTVKIMVSAEVLAQTADSMGNSMQIAKIYLDTAGLLGWTVMAIILSYLLELIVLGISKLVVRWKR